MAVIQRLEANDLTRTLSPRMAMIFFSLPLLIMIACEIVAILIRNNGVFSYTIDDAYIHLALAQRIQAGFYGINPGEFVAPSSSILWPLLLAVVPSAAPGWDLLPLLINTACTLVTVFLFIRVWPDNDGGRRLQILYVGAALAVALNLTTLVMSGMEHGLQVALTVLGIWGFIEFERKGHFPMLATCALSVAPLVRYENFAITVPACAYLVLVGRWKIAASIALITGGCCAIFSGFLMAHGGSSLPTSILSKTMGFRASVLLPADSSWMEASVYAKAFRDAAQMNPLQGMIATLKFNLMNRQSWILLLLTVPLVIRFLRPQKPEHRRLAGLVLTAAVLHMVAGVFDEVWFFGYEIYIVAAVLLVLVALYREGLCRIVSISSTDRASYIRALSVLVLSLLMFHRYAYSLLTIPAASSFNYRQNIEAARFVTDYWKRPVGVEPLGVSRWVDTYILDYAGLASTEVLHALSATEFDPLWMEKLAKRHRVGLVLMYWTPLVPPNWTKVARLHWTDNFLSGGIDEVVPPLEFYVTDPNLIHDARERLLQFGQDVPKGASLEML